ncbi:MAG: helix-turn-helix transcriptional regulator [bacterium]|nr:helix-turn-helix transcriptional regulator [bacterium]
MWGNPCGFESHLAHQNLAKNIERLRKAKGLSQEKLARLADVANNTLIKMESGENINPTLETLKKVAKALEVSVDDLIN